MPQVTFITPSGDQVSVENAQDNLMLTAVENDVEGILGDCGGVCACATCHVKITPEWIEKVGPATDAELGMLEFMDEYDSSSRLGCQVDITPELHGLVVHVVGQ